MSELEQAHQECAYQEFVRLVYEAALAQEEADAFDLHSDGSPDHLATWRRILREERQAFIALIIHCRSHDGGDVLSMLGREVRGDEE